MLRGLNESIAIQDVFVSGLGAVEHLEGNCLRLHFYVSEAGDCGIGHEKTVVARLIVSASVMSPIVMRLIKAVDDKTADPNYWAADLTH